VLYQPQIPQNTGNIGRTCVALGADLWLVHPLGFRMDTRHVRRAGLDYWQHLQWHPLDDWSAVLERFDERRMWLFSKTAERAYTEARYRGGDVLVFGSETQGLPQGLLDNAGDRAVRIPMRPHARSLNLACSVAIAAYEATRQIDRKPH
jgi:tRNA (cytidine/uridine-2'-O-)-methyltransferase